MIKRRRTLERRAIAMSIVVTLQTLAALFFILDFSGDLVAEGMDSHLIVEGAAALALVGAVLIGAFQVRTLVLAARADELAVALGRGAVSDLIQQRFAGWGLTAAEAEVALFAMKGCDAGEIARLRGAAAGTVRAQLTRVYAKSGVNSQSALVALFLDELIDPALVSRPGTRKMDDEIA